MPWFFKPEHANQAAYPCPWHAHCTTYLTAELQAALPWLRLLLLSLGTAVILDVCLISSTAVSISLCSSRSLITAAKTSRGAASRAGSRIAAIRGSHNLCSSLRRCCRGGILAAWWEGQACQHSLGVVVDRAG